MTDIVDSQIRSRMMSGIRGTDTLPEVAVRRFLHSRGFRFRLHRRDLPGRPDIVLPKHRAVVMVHGCFWHRHPGCGLAYMPKTRPAFWAGKFEANVARDQRVREELLALGWRVYVVWECALRDDQVRERGLEALTEWISSGARMGQLPETPIR